LRRILVITVLTVLFFILEFLTFNIIGSWCRPNFLILLIIFFNLYLGIRFGLYTAILAGVLADSYGTHVFGLNVVVFILCAYGTTFLRKYIYYRGSRMSRLILVFFICLIDFTARFILHAILGYVDWIGALQFALLPTLTLTLLITTVTFQQLRQCVSKLFV